MFDPIEKYWCVGDKLEKWIEALSIKHLWIASFLGVIEIIAIVVLLILLLIGLPLLLLIAIVSIIAYSPVWGSICLGLLVFLGLLFIVAHNLNKKSQKHRKRRLKCHLNYYFNSCIRRVCYSCILSITRAC